VTKCWIRLLKQRKLASVIASWNWSRNRHLNSPLIAHRPVCCCCRNWPGFVPVADKQLGRNENFYYQGDILIWFGWPSHSLPAFQSWIKLLPIFLQHHRADSRKTTRHDCQPSPWTVWMHCVAGTKEVAERLYAQPGSKAFGALSVRVQYLAECELICPVPAEDFYPQPVDSAVAATSPQIIPSCLDLHRLRLWLSWALPLSAKCCDNLKGIVPRSPHPITGTTR